MSKSERLDVVMLRNLPNNSTKVNGKLTNETTLSQYKNNMYDFTDWAADEFNIIREHHIFEAGFTPLSLAQRYADELIAQGKSPSTIHTYLAPVAKGLDIGMGELNLPKRDARSIKKNTKLHQNAVGAAQENKLQYARTVNLMKIVCVRPEAFCRLNISCLKQDAYGEWYVQVRDKGGKLSHQMIFDHEVDFVRFALSHDAEGKPLKDGAYPFTMADLGSIAHSKFRILRSQEIQALYERRFEGWRKMPSRTPEQRCKREQARIAAEKLKQEWIDKLVRQYEREHPRDSAEKVQRFREDISRDSRICLRGGNRENARKWNRPLSYERVSVAIASVRVLSHWEQETTIRNYLNK